MRATFGKGGWVGVDDLGLPGPLYVRVRPATDGRLRVSEFYLDGSESENDITQSGIRSIPLSSVEAFINSLAESAWIDLDTPGPDLSVLASYFRTKIAGIHPETADWVTISLLAQDPVARADLRAKGVNIREVPRHPRDWDVVLDDLDFVLTSGPTEGLTDDFLRDVKRAYDSALLRGERPNAAIAEQTGYAKKSVERWVSKARDRGIMPRGRQGRAG